MKMTKKEKSYNTFKEWLKVSLIKQREEIIQKKMVEHEKQQEEQETKKAKDNMKVLAKIAYKEWRERKNEEARHKRKVEKMEDRRQLQEQYEIREARR